MGKADWQNWRDCEAKRMVLERENERLRKQVETLDSELYKAQLNAHGGTEGAGAIVEKADEDRRKLIAEQEEQREWIASVSGVINFNYQQAIESYQYTYDQLGKQLDEMETLRVSQGEESAFAAAILVTIAGLEQDYVNNAKLVMDELTQESYDPINHPTEIVAATAVMHQLAMIYELANWLAELAILNWRNQDLRLVVDQIMRELHEKGSPNLDTLKKLPTDWIAKNIPNSPKNVVTLQKGLSDYVRGTASERSIRTYKGWYQMFEALSKRRLSTRNATE